MKADILTTWNIRCGIATYSSYLVESLKRVGVKVNVIKVEKPPSLNIIKFFKVVRKIHQDRIVHVQYQPGLFIPLAAFPPLNYLPLLILYFKYKKINRTVLTIHEIFYDTWLDRQLLKVMARFLNQVEVLIVHNPSLKELLSTRGVDEDKIVVLPHGTPPPELMDKGMAKDQLGLSGKRVLTIFGFVHKNKGHDLVLEVLPNLDPDVVLLVAGGPQVKQHRHYYRHLQRQAQELGVEDRVRFCGFVEDKNLPLVFNATDLAIFPYRWIITSGSFHQALSYQIPTLTSDLDYFQEIQSRYGCVELFHSGDKGDLEARIKDVLSQLDKQQYLQSRCQDFYAQTNWETVALETKKIYQSLKQE